MPARALPRPVRRRRSGRAGRRRSPARAAGRGRGVRAARVGAGWRGDGERRGRRAQHVALASVPTATMTYVPGVLGAVNETVKVPELGIVTEASVGPPSMSIENLRPGLKFTPVIVPLSPGA